MEPAREELVDALRGMDFRSPDIPFYSTVTEQRHDQLDSEYWGRNLREPVRFAAALRRVAAAGHSSYVEISPHPILLTAVEQELKALGVPGTAVGSLRRDQDCTVSMLTALGSLYSAGYPIDWECVADTDRPPVDLPTYAWEHRGYWLPETGDMSQRGSSPRPAEQDEPVETVPATAELLRTLRGAPPTTWHDRLTDVILDELADILGSGDDVEPEVGFFELGMNSVGALELKVRLERHLDCSLPPTIGFDYPNPVSLAGHLADLVREDAATRPEPSPRPASRPTAGGPPANEPQSDDLLDRFEREMAAAAAAKGGRS